MLSSAILVSRLHLGPHSSAPRWKGQPEFRGALSPSIYLMPSTGTVITFYVFAPQVVLFLERRFAR